MLCDQVFFKTWKMKNESIFSICFKKKIHGLHIHAFTQISALSENNKSVYIIQYILKSVICFKSLHSMNLSYVNAWKIVESVTLLCNSIKRQRKEKYKHRHTGFSILFFFFFVSFFKWDSPHVKKSLDKMTLFYIIKELQYSLNRKFPEYEFCF